ncbi:hypothetical protein DLM_3237 [Aquitalea magnusonii]|uniref:Solute-binding protein family 3/N-terminal domain-containing protein n=1 Tax=Aquitalea magnusonii TaxID=332411 RepID=A0A3G9GJH5_9NEIS|nr:ABC transporter substrate-binding protein [Aquitalea magnusonii]BBF86829.1 hypothetical protein DLM_3237 [Aquitalea magnusonii]
MPSSRIFKLLFAQHPCFALLALICLLGSLAAQAADNVIRYYPSGSIYTYRWALLKLALDHMEKLDHRHYDLVPLNDKVTQWRAEQLLSTEKVDILAFAPNAQREKLLQPVRMDILKGIIGYRVFFVRKEDSARFARMNAQQFRADVRLGLNSQWADYPIMKNNGYDVMAAIGYESLFEMLAAGRFDAFPRGLNEVGSEMQEQLPRYPGLTLEKTKAIYYPFPVYFWVNKQNTPLARRVLQGLKLAERDGSFKALFLRHHAAAIQLLAANGWQTTQIANTELPPGNVKPDTSWWWKRR